MKEFTILDSETVKFKRISEYPKFAWIEGIVNAVTHRAYNLTGSYIKISIYDDRLEIESPGKLPNIVNINNIKETRYSRNPRISRILTEFGWVRELNEGVKRIFQEMEMSYLDDPIYEEPNDSVRLTLKNNITIREFRKKIGSDWLKNSMNWDSLDSTEQQILICLFNRGSMKRSELERYIDRSSKTISNKINNLIKLNLITAKGKLYDPKRTYDININYND